MTLSQKIYSEVSSEAPSCLMKPDREYSVHELVRLLMHPRGIEHAIKSGYPTMGLLEEYKDELEYEPVRLLHNGEQDSVGLSGGSHLFAGGGLLSIDVAGSDNGVTTVVLLHGVKATVWASKYSTVKVYADQSCSVEVVNEDDTALIL